MNPPAYHTPEPQHGASLNSLRVLDEERRERTARDCYRAANYIVMGAMMFSLLPIGGLFRIILFGVAFAIGCALALVMLVKGAVGNGIVTLIVGIFIMPLWMLSMPYIARSAIAECRQEAYDYDVAFVQDYAFMLTPFEQAALLRGMREGRRQADGRR